MSDTYTPRPGSKAEAALIELSHGRLSPQELGLRIDAIGSVWPYIEAAIKYGAILRTADDEGNTWLSLPDGPQSTAPAVERAPAEAETAAEAPFSDYARAAPTRKAQRDTRKAARKAAKRKTRLETTEPTPAVAAAAVAPPAPAPATFGLFSDGTLCVARGDETLLSLSPADTGALIRHLVEQQALVTRLFDAPAATRTVPAARRLK